MPTAHRMTAYVIGHLSPLAQHIIGPRDKPLFAPKRKQRAIELFCLLRIMLQINRRRCPIILTSRVNAVFGLKAPQIFCKRLFRDCAVGSAPGHHFAAQIKLCFGGEQRFGKRAGLDQEKPVIIPRRERHIRLTIHLRGRGDIEHRHFFHRIAMIPRQSVRNAPAAIMSNNRKMREAQRCHNRHLIGCHGAFGIGFMARIRGRFFAVAIPSQIGRNDRMGLRQRRGNVTPDQMGLRIPV